MPFAMYFRRAAGRLKQVFSHLCLVVQMIQRVKLILYMLKIVLFLLTGDNWVIEPAEYPNLA